MTLNNFGQIVFSVLVFLVILAGIIFSRHMPGFTSRRRLAQRMREATETRNNFTNAPADGPQEDITVGTHWIHKVTRRLIAIGDAIPMLDAKQRTQLGIELTRAGFRERKAVSVLVGIKLVVGGSGSFGAAIFASSIPFVAEHFFMRLVVMAAAFIVGLILPETVLRFLVSRRQKKIATYLPDALDLMVICTNAGNSLPISIKRVAREMLAICPPMSDEFRFTADQLQIDGDTAAALRDMSTRIGVQSVRSLVTTLIQSQQYGTPISQSLKTLSRSERNAQMMILEEKASKLAPKMTVPMMLCILPTVGMIAAGPAVIRLMDLFSHQM